MVNVLHKSVCNIFLLILTFVVGIQVSLANPVSAGNATESLSFVENKGQIKDQFGNPRPDAHFRMKAGLLSIFVCAGSIHYQWAVPQEGENQQNLVDAYRMDVVMQNANTSVLPEALEGTGFYENYYTARLQGVQAYAYGKVIYRNIYNNIDWVLYVKDGGLKYDFIVHPGGNVSDIKIAYSGATNLSIKDGDLIATTPFGSITEKAPYTYDANSKLAVTSAYELNENILSFNVAANNGTTVIDPSLEWATYMGGTGNDFGVCLASDTAGNVYLAGRTTSANSSNVFTNNAHQTVFGGESDGFITRYTAGGVRTWSTYYGGDENENINSITVDNENNIIFCGVTDTSYTGLATNNAFHPAHGGGNSDAFLVKITPAGVRVWGTYYGGSGEEREDYNIETAVTTDADQNIYIVGTTTSDTGIVSSTTGIAQNTRAGNNDGFVAKFNKNGNRVWGTYFGGTGYDALTGVSASPNGFVYVTGSVKSSGLGTSGTHAQNRIGTSDYDVIIGKFNPLTGAKIWATYYGGSLDEEASGISVGDTNYIYITGQTQSTSGIATSNAEQPGFESLKDVFLAKFDSTGNREWGTYLGGDGTDNGGHVIIDEAGNINTSGNTASTNKIATSDGYSTGLNGTGSGSSFDAFMAIYTPTGKKTWGTYYGGSDNDYGVGIARGKAKGHVYMCGHAASTSNIAYSGSQMAQAGANDAFLVKFTPDTSVSILQPFTQTLHCSEDSFVLNYIVTEPFRTGNVFTVQLSNASGNFTSPTNLATINGTTAGNVKIGFPPGVSGTGYRLRMTATLPIDTSYDNGNDITIKPLPIWPVASNNGPTCSNDTLKLLCSNSSSSAAYSWTGPDNYVASIQNPTRVAMNATAHTGDYIVTVNLDGCERKDTTSVTILQAASKPTLTSNGPLCEGDNLQLNATPPSAGATIEWNGPGGWSATGSMSQTRNSVLATDGGKYYINLKLNGCQSKDSLNVVISAKPAPVNASANKMVLCSHEGLQLNASTSTSNVVYNWKGPNVTVNNVQNPLLTNINPSNSGDYIVTADLNGCVVRDTIFGIQIKQSPSKPEATAPAHICSNDDLPLTAASISGGATPSWSGPKGIVPWGGNPTKVFNAQVSDAGAYILTSTHPSGCSLTDTVNVSITQSFPLVFTPTITPGTVVCPTANLTFKINPAPTGNPVYTWSGPNGFSSSSPTPGISSAVYSDSGFYVVRVVTGACSVGIDSVHLSVVDTITAPVITLPTFDCAGDTMMVGIAHPYINQFYLKYPGVSTPVGPLPIHIMTNLSKANHEGQYIVSVSAGGCTAADTGNMLQVRPTPAKPNATSNSPICEGETLELKTTTSSGVVYDWTGPGSFSSSTQNPTIDQANPAINSGIYVSKVILDGCPSASDTEMVIVNTNPRPAIAPVLTFCEEGEIMLDVTNIKTDETYTWSGQSFNGSGPNVSISPAKLSDAGMYTVTAKSNVTGCEGTAISEVNITPLPGKPDATYKEPLCAGDRLDLKLTDTSTGNILYAWTGPNNFVFLEKEAFINGVDSSHTGMYIIRASREGCTIDDTLMVRVRPRPAKPDVSSNSPLAAGETLELTVNNPTPGASFKWTGPQNYGSIVQNPTLFQVPASASGTYTVLTTLDGCSSSGFVLVTVNKGDGMLDQLVLFPNPNTGNFKVKAKLSYDQIMPFEVISALGMVVYSDVVQSTDKQMERAIEIDGTLASGVYIFRMMISGQSKEIPFTIVR